jgi:type VI secretion system protein ImpH
MASTDRAAADRVALLRALADHPYQFDFFQALRRLEAAYRDAPRIGRSLRPVDDPIRFGQEPSLAFAPATLSALKPDGNGGKPRLEVAFGGLFGPQGPLPLHLTEYARDRIINSQDPTFARFLDIFHHRMLSLVYRVWADAQPTVQFDRPESDRFAAYVGSLVGINLPGLAERDAMPDSAKLFFAGRLVCGTRHAEGLEAMLGEFFHLPMQVVEFVGRWLPLPDDSRCELGLGQQAGHLGVSATIGDRVWDCQTKFRIVAGPMSLADYQRLLPGGASLERLQAFVKNYIGEELDWDLHLILQQDEVPRTELGMAGSLGWTSWLVSEQPQADADDLVLQPQAAA